MTSKVKIITHGCRLNLLESEVMTEHAKNARMDKRAGMANNEDVVIINTCAVTNEAVKSSRQSVRKAVRENPNSRIIVTGCAVQIDPDNFKTIQGVSQVLGNAEKMQADSYSRQASKISDIMQARIRAPQVQPKPNRSRAIVEVQTGCDHRCTFCIIPYGRGNSRSTSTRHVIEQVRNLVNSGMNEIVLSGVDISSWGEGDKKLGDLCALILSEIPNLPRLRLSSIDPAEVDNKLISLIANEPRFAPYLHLSVQHGDDMILKRMKRRHSRKQLIELCHDLRKSRPDISFGADIIAGFPTETEEMFANSISIIEECGLNWLHIFPYSPRTGTPAAKMPQMDRKTIKQRAKILREKGAKAKSDFLKSRAFGYDLALIEKSGTEKEHVIGRLADFCAVKLPQDKIRTGSLQPVRITGYDSDTLLGEFL